MYEHTVSHLPLQSFAMEPYNALNLMFLKSCLNMLHHIWMLPRNQTNRILRTQEQILNVVMTLTNI